MKVRDIVSALGGKWHGSSGTAHCPAHDDRNPSLSIFEGEDGRVLFHCHAGCSFESVRGAMKSRGFLNEEREKTNIRAADSRIVATYDYQNSDGDLRYQVVRFSPKAFRQRRPDGSDGWIWNLKGVSLIPYKLRELIAAKGEPIFVVEGEKDVEALRSLGLVATCNSGGAGKWRREFARYFEGNDVVILPDNDEPGHKHAEQVAQNLGPVAKRVRILDLPGLPPKGDPSDWVNAGGTTDDLFALAAEAPLFGLARTRGDPHWYADCITGAKGQVLSNHANVLLALRRAPEWKDCIGYDELRQQVMLHRNVPAPGKPQAPPLRPPRPWTDVDDAKAQEWFQIAGLSHVARDTVASAISQRAEELRYHAIRDLLEGLAWDGVCRIEGSMTAEGEIVQPWMTVYLGTENNDYTRAVGAMWLISAVARIFEPGCKADHILILEGHQGSGKSTACRLLSGEGYFSDGLPEIGTKDAKAHLAGKWIIELSELDAMIRSEPSAVKAFLSQQIDRFRPAYGRREVERPRQCIFVGTTNHSAYLKDETGARRYWPVRTGKIDLDLLKLDRDQILAEAVHLYRQGRQWHITDPALLAAAKEVQAARYDADVWEGPVAEYLDGKETVTVGVVMKEALNIDTPRMDRAAQNRVMRIMTQIGWVRAPRTSGARTWERASGPL